MNTTNTRMVTVTALHLLISFTIIGVVIGIIRASLQPIVPPVVAEYLYWASVSSFIVVCVVASLGCSSQVTSWWVTTKLCKLVYAASPEILKVTICLAERQIVAGKYAAAFWTISWYVGKALWKLAVKPLLAVSSRT